LNRISFKGVEGISMKVKIINKKFSRGTVNHFSDCESSSRMTLQQQMMMMMWLFLFSSRDINFFLTIPSVENFFVFQDRLPKSLARYMLSVEFHRNRNQYLAML
jgi:hypothetical protein